MLPREVANIHREKHNILVFLSNTLFFLLFTSLFPPFSQFQKMGGTWEELGRYMGGTFSFYLRYVLAFQSIPKRSSIEDKAKFYRRSIEHLSNIYRTPIEDLSKRVCVNCFIHLHKVCLLFRRMGISPSIFFLTNGSSARTL